MPLLRLAKILRLPPKNNPSDRRVSIRFALVDVKYLLSATIVRTRKPLYRRWDVDVNEIHTRHVKCHGNERRGRTSRRRIFRTYNFAKILCGFLKQVQLMSLFISFLLSLLIPRCAKPNNFIEGARSRRLSPSGCCDAQNLSE